MSDLYLPNNDETPQAPLLPDGTPKKRFEVITVPGPNNTLKNMVYIDGEYLDWSFDVKDFMEARKRGGAVFAAVKKDIIRHYCESVSEFIGRRVTPQDIDNARKTGWI
jgi:hypothetical protein